MEKRKTYTMGIGARAEAERNRDSMRVTLALDAKARGVLKDNGTRNDVTFMPLNKMAQSSFDGAIVGRGTDLAGYELPTIEVEETNPYIGTEGHLPVSSADGFLYGFGSESYPLAMRLMLNRLGRPPAYVPEPASACRVWLINGPNLNMLGLREPHIYGSETLKDVENACLAVAKVNGVELVCKQSNYEGDLVSWIQEARGQTDALIMNAGAYTHTSIAIHDAFKSYEGFAVELHVSNTHKRETFRHTSLMSPAVGGIIAGHGTVSYTHLIGSMPAVLRAVSRK